MRDAKNSIFYVSESRERDELYYVSLAVHFQSCFAPSYIVANRWRRLNSCNPSAQLQKLAAQRFDLDLVLYAGLQQALEAREAVTALRLGLAG